MSTGISCVNLPFSDGVKSLSTGESMIDTLKRQALDFEVFDPVPVYRQEELLQFADDVLESPESKSALRKAVQDLGDSAYSIEICFNNVADGLRKAQAQGTQAQSKKLQKYADDWAAHQKAGSLCSPVSEYVDLLWTSRRIAGHARVIAKDFAGDFLGLMEATDITLGEKKAEISAYRKQLDEDAKKSSDLSQRFDGLRRAVENFESDVMEFLKAGHSLEAELQATLSNVAEIKRQISQLDMTLLRSIRFSLGTAGIALGAIALSVLCPPLWFIPITMGAVSVKKGKLVELKKRRVQLEEQTRDLEGLQKIHPILDPLKSDIDLIKEKLAVFGQIWQLIHADLSAVEKDLELATNAVGVALFKRRLQTTSKAYALLADALYQYETNPHIQRVGKLGH
ncbi:hypothetical protein EDD15DRAFT_2374535 [Pisolithus albus]|nr:hypothetical protein EDD15DRAFT_2374535 [Pisolithus albus]